MIFRKRFKAKDQSARAWQDFVGQTNVSTPVSTRTLLFFWGSLLIVMLTLVGRLAQLQVVEGAYYRARAENNRIISRRLTPQRGILTDRNGTPLVRNIPSYKRLDPDRPVGSSVFKEVDREQALSLAVGNDEWVFLILRESIYMANLWLQ